MAHYNACASIPVCAYGTGEITHERCNKHVQEEHYALMQQLLTLEPKPRLTLKHL